MQRRLNTTASVIATTDAVVHDPIIGIDRKVFAGQAIPPELVHAYRKGGCETREGLETHAPGTVIAAKTITVHDDAIGIDRRLIAGQPVPRDLVNAYNAAIGGDDEAGDSPAGKYADWKRPALEAEVDERELDITGTGANGNVLVKDLIAALEANDAASTDSGADGDGDGDGDDAANTANIEKED